MEGQLENDEDDEDDEPFTQQVCHYSKMPRDAEPKATTMKYYPPGWQSMLKMAKNNTVPFHSICHEVLCVTVMIKF